MDAEYLKSSVGDALAEGMSRLVMAQPEDAVEWLGAYLVNYADAVDAKALAAAKAVREDQELEAAAPETSTSTPILPTATLNSPALQAEEDALVAKLSTTDDLDSVMPALITLIKKQVSISGEGGCGVGAKGSGYQVTQTQNPPKLRKSPHVHSKPLHFHD